MLSKLKYAFKNEFFIEYIKNQYNFKKEFLRLVKELTGK